MLSDDRMARIADPAASPEATAIHRNEVRRLLTAINALPPRRRQSFVLNKLAGLTYNEIALRMGMFSMSSSFWRETRRERQDRLKEIINELFDALLNMKKNYDDVVREEEEEDAKKK